MVHTFLILDGHPGAFAPTQRPENTILEPKDQLPPYPLWSCMVQSTLEFCRIGWTLAKDPINVLVAGRIPIVLNDIDQQTIYRLQQQFPLVQPRETYREDRLQLSIDKVFSMFVKQQTGSLNRCRLVLIVIAKDNNEKLFEFRNNANEMTKDLRILLHKAADKHTNLDHVQVDILRLFSHSEQLPDNIINKRVSDKLTVSVHNIPNGYNDLNMAMIHLAQLYFDVDTLNILKIPMKSSEQQQSTHTVTLYYKLEGHHLINRKKTETDKPIHDPNFLSSRQLSLIYLKRSKRAIQGSEWCTCRHIVSPMKMRDLPTEVYVDMTLKGSISYLMTPEASQTSKWTHVLMAENNNIYLYCFNNKLQEEFSRMIDQSLELIEVKPEGMKKSKKLPSELGAIEFTENVLKPNLHLNMDEFLTSVTSNPLYHLIHFNPTKYAPHHLVMIPKASFSTTQSIERATRQKPVEPGVKEEPKVVDVKSEDSKASEIMDIDQAWNQVQQYENMTLREKEEVAQGVLPAVKQTTTGEAQPFSHQLPVAGVKVNTNFRGRRGAPIKNTPALSSSTLTTQPPIIQKYPDPTLAVPYLNPIPPTLEEKENEEKQELEKLGEPGNLLWLYWMNDKLQRSSQGLPMNKKVKREFEGRIAQPGEKGEI
ncbi:hypothetical protein BCV71DRAFT_230952 [Rhizopus microsporus]|uniref:Uncharacterized protein n=1 Tax=Rhizopus microsporus TaxID=58291 RepID=A0A1X0SF20_RHIZD|nr:hypothetical protein BCV71DRAFT_230952 [Rhizopus microsporus]